MIRDNIVELIGNTGSSNLSVLVQSDRLQLLYRQSYPAVFYSLISATILTAILWPAQNPETLLSWFGLLLLSAMGRLYLFKRYHKTSPQGQEIIAWKKPFFITLMLSSIIWGVGSLMILPPDSQLHQMIVFSFLIAMTGGAICFYSSYSIFSTVTIAVMLLPVIGYSLIIGSYISVGIASIAFVYFIAAIRASHFISATMQQNLMMTHQLAISNKEITRLAHIDDLTGLYNRRAFYEFANVLTNSSQRSNDDISIIHMDVDNFKTINDSYGHAAGDAALQRIGQILQKRLRKSDVFARIGGEEFCMLLSATPLENATQLAEELRQEIAQTSFTYEKENFKITASFGVSSDVYDIDTLVGQADELMYQSKNSGRNRVTCDQ